MTVSASSVERLAALVPQPVRGVCARLREAGHRAFAVGGAVRDAMLGRQPGDWDVTTSAHPEQVVTLFRKTIPIGIEHGTVTVVFGRGSARMPIEVTTFRSEGTYTDARRPDQVTFGVSLEEDLARRDFVINAMAFDPIDGVLEDPFGGARDIEAKVVRAVGNPVERFTEDGLRIMRAVRFVSALDFSLDPDTEAALEVALPSLARVAAERVRVELLKLLAGPGAERALELAHHRRVFATAVPILANLVDWQDARDRAIALPVDPVLRLAGLLLGKPASEIEAATAALTLSGAERSRIATVCRLALGVEAPTDSELRAILGSTTRERALDLGLMWLADGDSVLAERTNGVLDSGDALVTGELALSGKDVMEILGIGPSREIGVILGELLAAVHREPGLNTHAGLRALLAERKSESV